MHLQGMNITITILRPHQDGDDDMGGSRQRKGDPVGSGLPARISSVPSPLSLRVQGIEAQNLYNCNVCRPAGDYSPLVVEMNDIVIPESGQYQGQEFIVTSPQDDSIADSPNDFRTHKALSLRRVVRARRVQ